MEERARLTFAAQEEPRPRMTVAPLGAETSMDLNCTVKGQHMTRNQSAPNWMISSHLNMFLIFYCMVRNMNMGAFFTHFTASGNIKALK